MDTIRAFPKGTESNHPDFLGMTLRDYFAAQALPPCMKIGIKQGYAHSEIVALAFSYADEMMQQSGEKK